MKITCPACGSDALNKSTREAKVPIEFGREVSVEETIYVCQICGTDGDFADENDKLIEHALEAAKIQTTDFILESLVNNGISMAYFERAMGLPARTLARWKKGKISASGFALVKTIETYPWILEVADERFDRNFAINKMVQKAHEVVHSAMQPLIIRNEQSVTRNGDTVTINASVTLQEPINITPTNINNSNVGQMA